MNRMFDVAIYGIQVAIVAGILTLIALVAVDAWIIEDGNRVAKLKQHFWDVAYSRVEGPKAPTGLKPHYTDKATPKVTYFQDASERGK